MTKRKYINISMKKIFVQSCIDCGFFPSKDKVAAFDKHWDITEIDWRSEEENRRAPHDKIQKNHDNK